MSLINAIITKIFPRPDKIETGEDPVISEPINRSEKFKERYLGWTALAETRSMIDNIARGYDQFILAGKSELPIGKYKDRGIEGMYLEGSLNLTGEEFSFLLDFLKERVLTLNYRFYRSLYEARDNGKGISLREQYYFKPIPSSFELPVSQEYGNITLELDRSGDTVTYLKIFATTYSGYNYQPSKNFDELIWHLLRI